MFFLFVIGLDVLFDVCKLDWYFEVLARVDICGEILAFETVGLLSEENELK